MNQQAADKMHSADGRWMGEPTMKRGEGERASAAMW